MLSNRPDTRHGHEPVGCEKCGFKRGAASNDTHPYSSVACPRCLDNGYWYALLGPREMRWRADQWVEQGFEKSGRYRHRLAQQLERME